MLMGRRSCSGVSRRTFTLMFEIKFYNARKLKSYGTFDCNVKEAGWSTIDSSEHLKVAWDTSIL